MFSGSGDFTRISSQRGPCASPSLFYTRAYHNLGKALGEGLGLLCGLSPLYPSLSLSLPLSPSLSLSIHLCLSPSLSLSLISPSLSISLLLPFFLSLYFSLSFSLASLMDVFVLVFLICKDDFHYTVDKNISDVPQNSKWFLIPFQNSNFSNIAITILNFSLLLPI